LKGTDTLQEREQLEQVVAALEAQRFTLGDAVVEAALTPIRAKLAALSHSIAPVGQAGERKQITVMFADLSGFTTLSEGMDAEQVRSLVNDCFSALVPVIEKFGGVVDKFIGDEIMALFGAPMTHENDAERALCAALEMMEALADFNAKRRVGLGMHFGINTGLVVAGGMGAGGHQQYSVMGDTVNIAARLGNASEPGQILVGPVTYRLTAPLFRFDPLAAIQLKGKAEPVAAYRLLARKTTPESARGIAGLRSRLVGREGEMQSLIAATHGLASGKGDLLAIIAEAGLGKSRLVSEARHSTADASLWIEGRALSHAQGSSYALAGNLLDGLIGVGGDSSRPDVSSALREFIRLRMPDKVDDVYPYLARLRDVPLEAEAETRIQEFLPEALQGRIRAAFGELIRVCAGQGPMVLVWEDLHWSDPSSMGLLESLVPLTETVPMLLLLVFRPEEGGASAWYRKLQHEHGNRYRALELLPLNQAESEKLIENLLKIENLPHTTLQSILSKSEGNPFFLEELLRSLIDAGLVLLDGDRAVATHAISQLEIPDTLQSVIAARIDRLPSDAKRILQTASVIGREFPRTIVDLVLRSEGADLSLDAALGELLRRELVRRRDDLKYIFKHAITRDVAYNTLLIARRKELHRQTAETMEALFADQLDELASTLAHHFAAGEAREKAVHYLTRAADRARQTYANAEAIAFYRAAVEQVDELRRNPDRPEDWREKAADLNENLGSVLGMIGQVDEALEAYAAARSCVPATDAVAHARLHRREGIALNVLRRTPEMLAAHERAVAVLGAPANVADERWWQEWIDLQLERMWGLYVAASTAELMALIADARPVIERRGTPTQRSRLFESMILADLRKFRYYMLPVESLENARHQLAAAEASGNRRMIGRAKILNGFVHLWRNEPAEAERSFRDGLRDVEQVGDLDTQFIGENYMAVVGRKRGDVEMTRLWADRTLALARKAKNVTYEASSLASLGWVAWREGDETRAQTYLTEAMLLGGKAPSPLKFMAVGPLLAIAAKHRAWSAAIEHAQTLLHPSHQKMPDDVQATLEQAVKAWESGAIEEAGSLLVHGVEMLRQKSIGYV
jgi:class 3 adenylate cyclase/tetratricopeptide (TPR) repeat protein